MDGKNFYSHFHGEVKTDVNGLNYTADDEAVDAMIERLLNPVDDRPICAFAGLMAPHTPYEIEEPYFSAINRELIPKRIRPELCKGKPYMEELLRKNQHMQDYSEKEWTELKAVYYAMCMKVDAQFGRLCDALKKAGIYDDCAIFVLSDHGDFTGDYGLPEKAQNCFEECLVSVPFLIKPPKNFGVDAGVSGSLVELVDFYATAMDFAGLTPDHTHFGKSLLPILKDRSIKHREYVFCEGGRMPCETHCTENNADGGNKSFVYYPRKEAHKDDLAHAKGTMIRNERFKYIKRALGSDEFYDLWEDPCEMMNQIDSIRYASDIARLKEEMLCWYQGTCDVVPYKPDSRFNMEMLFAMIKPKIPKEKWDSARKALEESPSLSTIQKLFE